MVEISFDDVVKLYDENYFTLEGVYAYCKTDLEMYNFLKDHCNYDEDEIKEKMREVSWADDAYYNALDQAKWEE